MNTFENKMTVGKIPNENIFQMLIDYAIGKGVPVYSTTRGNYRNYPNITFDNEAMQLVGNCAVYGDTSKTWISIEEFFEYCNKYSKIKGYETVKLTSQYSAKVYNNRIEVGCQTIKPDALKELFKVAKEKQLID